ncbi:MAG: hypothetical protein V2J89_07520, partial [Halieaceae bacterium]|nr:hypothetical protein [Halieaceae bacterium]
MQKTQHTTYNTLWQAGDYAALDAHLRLARASDPDADTLVWSALCARAQNDLHAAFRYAAQAITASRTGEIYGLLGRLGEALKRPSLQLLAWQSAINQDPDNLTYRKALAEHYRALGNDDMADALIAALVDTDNAVQRSAPVPPTPDQPPRTLPAQTTVILVPVYDDLEATQACVTSLVASLAANSSAAHVLLIDDASP